jgi:hypothetical protein
VGLLTTGLGIMLALPKTERWNGWWGDVVVWTRAGGPDPAMSAVDRSTAGWHVIILLVALIGGLLVMLASLQLGQADIRKSPSIRRLLYGYNAVLAGFLLLVILAVANAFVGTKFSRPLDFTESAMYTISPRAQTILSNLQRPVTVYLLLREQFPEPGVAEYTTTLLNNCQDASEHFHWEQLSLRDRVKLQELADKYPALEPGLLVEYDTGGGKEYKMIPAADLGRREFGSTDENPDSKPKLRFTAEEGLMTALNSVNEPKRPILYFTQGNDELNLDDPEGIIVNQRTGQKRPNMRGGARLRDRLDKRNFEVRTFDPGKLGQDWKGKSADEIKQLMAEKYEVLDSADVIVVAGPNKPFSPAAVSFLMEYYQRKKKTVGAADGSDGKTLYGAPNEQVKDSKGQLVQLKPRQINRDGKLLIMLPAAKSDGTVQETGLEPLLAQNSVLLPPFFLITVPQVKNQIPELVLAEVKPGAEQSNFLAAAFKGRTFATLLPRPVQVRPSPPGGMSPVHAEPILVSSSTEAVIPLRDLNQLYGSLFSELSRNPRELERRIAEAKESPLAVAVSEGSGMPAMPGHPPTGAQTPRMVVIGSSTMVSNYFIDDAVFQVNFDFFASALDWLRDKPTISIVGKQVQTYTLPPSVNQEYWSFVLLPALLVGLSVVGTGTGIWLTRRR